MTCIFFILIYMSLNFSIHFFLVLLIELLKN